MGERKEEIRTIVIEPGKDPRMETIRNDLHTLQRLVGGYIEAVPLAEDMAMIVKEATRIVNMEGCPVLPRSKWQTFRIPEEAFDEWVKGGCKG